MSVETRILQLGLTIPELTDPVHNYVPTSRVGDLMFVSGQTPTVDGRLTVTGHVGKDVSPETARTGARLAALNGLAAIRAELGSLDQVRRVLKLTGYVASAPGFGDQPQVVNGASQLLEDVFGQSGRHARTAIGVAELPGGAPVEVELIVAVRSRG